MSDTTERRGADVFPLRASSLDPELARQVARVSRVFDAAPIGVGVWSVQGAMLHANPVLCELLGAEPDDIVGTSFRGYIDPRDEAGVARLVEELWSGARNYLECDFRCRPHTGEELWLRCHLHAVFGPSGDPDYLVSQIFSFVNRRTGGSADAQLVESSPAMLWLTDVHGIPRFGNKRVYAFLGLPDGSAELRGALFETIHPEDLAEAEATMRAHIEQREPFDVLSRSRRSDGEWRWLHHHAVPNFSELGEFTGYSGVSHDVTDRQDAITDLQQVAQLFESVSEAGPLAVLRTDPLGRVVYANGRWADLLDNPDARLTGLAWRSALIPEHIDEVVERATRAVETREPFVMRVRAHDSMVAPERSEGFEGRHWAELRVSPVYTPGGVHDGFVATIADISAEVASNERADQLARVLDAGTDYLIIVERNGRISYANNAAEEALGVTPRSDGEAEAEGEPFLMDVLDADSFTFYHEVVEPVLHEAMRWKGELTMRDRTGRTVPVSALVLAHANDLGRIENISMVARDISDLKQAQYHMRQLATHDYLTGLPNRVLLYERLDLALARYHRLGQMVALLYLDLDRFKPINDQLGHHVGDAVLVTLADRMHAVVRDTDTPARIGGDEFAVLVEGFEGPELLERVATRLIDAISEPMDVQGYTVQVGVSIGIVSADATTSDADSLLARGDAAMYAAKAAGRGRFVIAGTMDREAGATDGDAAAPVAVPGDAAADAGVTDLQVVPPPAVPAQDIDEADPADGPGVDGAGTTDG
jgi:diguanylate cyclase (GGDEF)-like protein/PAS domain S-box-containing protein